ncbi:penicillin-binding transpeptidase domain-containing protein [Rathayibacter sp. VKM Ac-2927]|uniref:penicillin-binding transpeptidase domain-containing protein n=1 Tax=Rathayibacter sp. VKM Ac-2927 TaxID=2929478 RepID=UPI001FB21F10|nr:penicillin-binding transpeptidase domain-containing protein [Rathayibacter sp. VKM Ac-2927]MCJ1688144.1 FtsW/RodA/SpoVE family cell cycle protein [Rathayibacter sp. VKM Ac-2927]
MTTLLRPAPRANRASSTEAPGRGLVIALLLLLAASSLGAVAVEHFRGPDALVLSVCTAAIGALVGAALAVLIARDPATTGGSAFPLGFVASVFGVLLRLGPPAFGSINSITVAGITVVVGEVATLAMIVGTGTMLAATASHESSGIRRSTPQRAFLVTLTLVPLVPFTLASVDDLGPLVVLLAAVIVMAGRASGALMLLVVSSIAAGWAAVTVLDRVPIAQERLWHVLEGDYQLDTARLAVGFGAFLWGGGFGSNGFAEAIPVAESDHLPAYLVGSLGVAPFLAVIVIVFVALSILARRLAAGSASATIAATGMVVAAAVQLSWSVLGSVGGVLPLTGLPLPWIGASGSTSFVWWFVAGFVVVAAYRDRPVFSWAGPGRRLDSSLVGRVIAFSIACVSVIVPAATSLAAGALIAAPSASGIGGGMASLAIRGDILSADGKPLAVREADGTTRYPQGELTVETVGLIAPGVNQYGLERAASAPLTCGGATSLQAAVAGLIGPRCVPADVVSTLVLSIQEQARAATAGYTASVLVLDLDDGGILAAYSSNPSQPRPDPGLVASGELDIDAVSPLLETSPFSPAVLNETVLPGSVFKIPVLAAAAESGVMAYEGPAAGLDPDLLGVENAWGGSCPAADFAAAIAYSCNSVTAATVHDAGQQATADGLHTYFGFDGDPLLVDGQPVPAGTTGLQDELLTDAELSRSAIGLQSVSLTLLDIARASALAVGADADLAPHLLAGVCVSDEQQPVAASPSPTVEPLGDATVALIRAGMAKAVTDGTATALLDGVNLPEGVTLLAKTGTPDRLVDGATVYDSLSVVVVGERLIVTRVAGTLEAPTPNHDHPALLVARDMLPSILQADATRAADACSKGTR